MFAAAFVEKTEGIICHLPGNEWRTMAPIKNRDRNAMDQNFYNLLYNGYTGEFQLMGAL